MRVTVVLCIICVYCGGTSANDGFNSLVPRSEETGENFLSDSLLGQQLYVFTSDDKRLADHSSWSDGDSPRCSPRRAMRISAEWMSKNLSIVDEKEMHWDCCSIRLRKATEGVWFWVVDYEYLPRAGQSTGIPHRFSVPIFADGTIPQMKIQKAVPTGGKGEKSN